MTRRRLSEEERAIWERISGTVRPLRPRLGAARRPAAAEAEPPEPLRPAPALAAPPKQKPPPLGSALPPPPKRSTPLAPGRLDPKTMRRLQRGSVEVDGRIDLHGMRQERAHHALLAFLMRARAEGARIVLVVTGKGKPAEAPAPAERRGVLRQSVPGWLSHPELAEVVAGFTPASRRHGGDGALYVRIKRPRGRRLPSR